MRVVMRIWRSEEYTLLQEEWDAVYHAFVRQTACLCKAENRFGGDCVTYMGDGGTKKWERLESYGLKFVESIVQAISRDILVYAMKTLRCYNIVAHVHVIIEADWRMSLTAVCEQMERTPSGQKVCFFERIGMRPMVTKELKRF